MKKILFLIVIALSLSSCGVFQPAYKCRPSKGSRDYAFVTRILHDQDNLVYVRAKHYRNEWHIFFKCLPDSIKVGKRVNISGWAKI